MSSDSKPDALELFLHLALGAQVEIARVRGRRPTLEITTKRARSPAARRAREAQHGIDVDSAEALLRAGLADGRAEAAQRGVAADALQLRLEALELHDAVGEARMLAPERPARHRQHAS